LAVEMRNLPPYRVERADCGRARLPARALRHEAVTTHHDAPLLRRAHRRFEQPSVRSVCSRKNSGSRTRLMRHSRPYFTAAPASTMPFSAAWRTSHRILFCSASGKSAIGTHSSIDAYSVAHANTHEHG